MSATPDVGSSASPPRRFARPYALTGGRTRSKSSRTLTLDTLVMTTPAGHAAVEELSPEQREIVLFCAHPLSVAELSVRMHVPLGVARVLASDLHADGMVEARRPPETTGAGLETLLERVLDGLRAL
jgi:hypothetical protein